MNKTIFFLFFYSLISIANAATLCDQKKSELTSTVQMSLHQCQKAKESPRCQELYQQIKEDGGDLSSKALRCEVDSDLTKAETLAVSYIACLKGGIEGGIVTPIKELGKWLGESAAKVVISIQENRDRLRKCDADPKIKEQIFNTYNLSVPKLLKLNIPANFQTKSCAQLEADLYQARGVKQRAVANQLDYKQFQKNPKLTPEESEYLKWKFKPTEFAAGADKSLTDMADSALEAYGVRIDCYNLEARTALRCEALFNIATLGVGVGKTAISALSGLKAERFVKSVQAAQEAGSLRAISEADKMQLMLKANTLNKAERTLAAEKLLGKTLTSDQKEAILRAHEVGLGKGARKYSKVELRQKAKILGDAGFSGSERELLMRSGVTGEFDDYLQASKIAKEAEDRANLRVLDIERRKAEKRSKLKDTKLSAEERQKLETEIAEYDKQIEDLRAKVIIGDVIGPGNGPADLARIERRIGYTTRQIEIAEANGMKVTPLIETRARTLRESAEFRAMGKDYRGALREYDLAARDVVSAVESGGLKTFDDKVTAMRILENAGADNYTEAYRQLASDIARMPQVKNRVVDPSKMQFSAAVQNPVVANQQRGSVWDLVRDYRDQSTRIEIQRARNFDLGGSSWEKNARSNDQFNDMVNQRAQIQQKILDRVTAEAKGNTSAIQKTMKELGF